SRKWPFATRIKIMLDLKIYHMIQKVIMVRGRRMKMRLVRAMWLATAMSTVLAVSPAQAQEQEGEQPAAEPPTDDTGGEAAESIVVTGTRIVRNGNDAPTPVSVVTAAEIQKAAPATIADYVNQLPALSGSTTPKSHGNTVTNGGANLLNLRSLGVNR